MPKYGMNTMFEAPSSDFDSEYLIEMEARVRHYEVYSETSPDALSGK